MGGKLWKALSRGNEMKDLSGWWLVAAGIVVAFIPWLFWVGLLTIAWGVWKIWNDKKPENDPWLPARAGCQYKWAYGGTGLALDITSRTIHLKSKQTQKSYSFDDIREWKYNVQTGGEIINGSVGVNAGIHMKNKAESGLFVLMRDIEHPQ